MTFIIVVIVFIALLFGFFVVKFFLSRKKKNKSAENKEKKVKQKKEKNKKKENVQNKDIAELKSAYVDVVDKFLYRKELKLLVLVSKSLPKGYVAFPKVGLDTILEPVGKRDLYETVKNENIDIVIFDELTMKPRVAIDIFDGSIGDEQVDIASPNVIKAFEIAQLPLVRIKVKTDYTENEIKEPIYSALGINVPSDKNEEK